MELLETAVVDVALLMATSRALRGADADGDASPRLKGRRRLRDELRRGAAAYLGALVRGEQAAPGPDLLAACRVAAERRMPRAIAAREDLRLMMRMQPGALEGLALARHDLWRLAHLAIHLRRVASSLEAGEGGADGRGARKTTRRLGKRLRRALVAYVRAGMRAEAPVTAGNERRAAIAELGAWSAADAASLAQREGDEHRRRLVELGVCRALSDLLADWAEPGAEPPAGS